MLNPQEFRKLFRTIAPKIIFQWFASQKTENTESSNPEQSIFFFYWQNIPHITKITQHISFQEFFKVSHHSTDSTDEADPSTMIDSETLMRKIGDSIFGNDKKTEHSNVNSLPLMGFSSKAQEIIALRKEIATYEEKILQGEISLQEAANYTEKIAQIKKEIQKILQTSSETIE